MNRSPVLIPLLMVCLLGLAGPVPAQDEDQVQQQLAEIRRQIAELSATMEATRGERDRELGLLREVESEIGELGRQIRASDAEIAALDRRAVELDAEERRLRDSLGDQQLALAAQLRSAHTFGNQPRLKLMLDLDDPAQIGRVFRYYHYYNRARMEFMTGIGEELQELARIVTAQQKNRDDLVAASETLRRQRADRQAARGRRAEIVDALRRELTDQETRLGSLDQDQQRLVSLLERLRDLFADIPADPSAGPFASLRGRLGWPVEGEVVLKAGQSKPGGMQLESVVIQATAGSPVRSVSYGRVAYADWLRGFGLLAIVDHGDGYMSLYGFNESLIAEVGDWVEAGEVIAEVGRSGAQDRDALYFEIRRDGQPVDPMDWFAARTP